MSIRDGRQVRVAFGRYGDKRIRQAALDLILNVEDLARSHPDGLDAVTRSVHAEILGNLRHLSAKLVGEAVDGQLERLNAHARRVLNGPLETTDDT